MSGNQPFRGEDGERQKRSTGKPPPEIGMLRRKFRAQFGRDPYSYKELQDWWNVI